MVKAAVMLIIPDVSQLMFTVGVRAFTSAEATRCRLLKKTLSAPPLQCKSVWGEAPIFTERTAVILVRRR